MILDDPQGRPTATGIGGRATLDDLFRRAVARRPDAIALIDPPNRARFTDGEPRTLTYAQADRMISAIAGRLRRTGLPTDAIVAIQIANSVECVLTLLAVLRAGMIAMPLPLLWRRADTIAALARVGVSALIVGGRVGQHDQFDCAIEVAAEIFAIRLVCGFGSRVPDGVIPLDDLFAAETLDPLPPPDPLRSLPPGPAAHLAVVTWDMTADGLFAVGRSHAELVAGGLAVVLEGRLQKDATLLTTLTMASFAGLATALVPWLLVGGTLVLHQPFDASTFAAQQRAMDIDVVCLPGSMIAELADAGCLADSLGCVVALWRAPERLPRAHEWWTQATGLVDVQVFGETGLIPVRRGPDGRPGAVPFGPVSVPRGGRGVIVAEIRRTGTGTVAMRGPMVPRCPFPAGVERTSLPHLKVDATGFVDTGYACRSDRDKAPLVVTAPPPGMIDVGGYRFVARDLQTTVAAVELAATLAALPDAHTGHRLAGSAPDQAGVQRLLAGRGVNPLLADAFRPRPPEPDPIAPGV